MKNSVPGLLAATVLLLAGTVQADYQDLQIARTVERVAAIQNYRGVLEQTGLFGPATVVTEVAFRRPHDIWTRVTAPAELAGTVTSYRPDELLIYSPQQELALRLRNLTAPDTAREGERIAAAWRTNADSYFYSFGKVQDVAGLATIAIDQRARYASQLVQSSLTRVYDDYSFPLAGNLTLNGGARLDYRYRSIAFNQDASAVPTVPALPPSTLLIDWDLAATARSEAEVQARLPKALPFPQQFAGLARDRLLIHPDAVPATAAWYRDANYYLLITASRDTGFQPLSREYGLEVPLGAPAGEGSSKARLVLAPWLSTWSFRRDGVLYTVLSNLHPETLYRELGKGWGVEAGKASRLKGAPTVRASRPEGAPTGTESKKP